MMFREIALPARMASLFSAYKIGAVCQEAFVKTADLLGPCLAWTMERKSNFSRSNKPEVKTAMKIWAFVVGVLILLLSISYLVQHPSTVDQTFAKVFQHNGAETP